MRLAEFILANVQPILAAWDAFARSLAPGRTTRLALRNDAEAVLRAAARDMQVSQSGAQQVSKSQGHGGAGGAESDRLDHASEMHGAQRVGLGFDIIEVVSEYRALRASVLRLWRESFPEPDLADIDDITRFNESMDQSLAQAVASYTKRIDQARHMFLAILSHDLRNPLSCIRMAALFVSRTVSENPKSAYALSQIDTNAEAIRRLIDDLIDFASTGLGNAMPLTCAPVDLEKLCREVVEACRTAYPGRTLRFHPDGDLSGEWDPARLRQMLSNLVGNALQHGSEAGPIDLSAVSAESDVVLSVRNEGAPIPPELLATIFDPLVRHAVSESAVRRAQGSIGLGLYIVREIVVAHGGTVEVASTDRKARHSPSAFPGRTCWRRAGPSSPGRSNVLRIGHADAITRKPLTTPAPVVRGIGITLPPDDAGNFVGVVRQNHATGPARGCEVTEYKATAAAGTERAAPSRTSDLPAGFSCRQLSLENKRARPKVDEPGCAPRSGRGDRSPMTTQRSAIRGIGNVTDGLLDRVPETKPTSSQEADPVAFTGQR